MADKANKPTKPTTKLAVPTATRSALLEPRHIIKQVIRPGVKLLPKRSARE